MAQSRPDPGSAVFTAMTCAGAVSAQFIAGKATRDALYLGVLDVTSLPVMVIGTWYGMNFDLMKELHSPHGYQVAAGITIASTLVTAIYLKKKRWF